MSHAQFVDIADSSTKNVAGQIPVLGGPYYVHSDELNEHSMELDHNGSGTSGYQKLSPSVNEVGFATPVGHATPNPKKRDIFSALKTQSSNSRINDNIDIGAMWQNIAPAIQRDLGMSCTSASTLTSHILSVPEQTSMGTTRSSGEQGPQPPASTDKFVDDYAWPLGDQLQTIQDELKSNTLFNLPPNLHSSLKKEGKQPTNPGLPSLYTSSTKRITPTPPSTPIKSRDKTIFTPPPAPPSIIHVDYFQTTRTPDLRRTPSSVAPSAPPSPIFLFTDGGSRRAWSESSRRSRSIFSQATTPPSSPVVAARDGHAWAEDETSRQVTPEHGDARNLFNEDDSADLFGEDTVPESIVPKSFAESGSQRIILKRPIEELKALRVPKKKAKRNSTKRATAGQIPVRPITKPKEFPTSSSRGIKRPPSPVRPSLIPPPKRQATEANLERRAIQVRRKPLPPSTYVRWTSSLSTFEDQAYQGKHGPGQIERLVALLKDMKTNIDIVPDAWVRETVRTRTVNGVEERKNKHQLLAEIVGSYGEFDEAGTVDIHSKELLVKWSGLTKK
ncbi:hypothetical protein B0H13DRAFT_1945360 [Mycena leptocephala]|nr:hypothetical protein B0H13DRAFT_1945360 [Mycena leptocephala]